MSRARPRRSRLVAVVALALAAAAALGVAQGYAWYRAPIRALAAPTAIDVEPGEGLAALAQRLATRGLVTRPRLWTLIGRLEGKATRLRAGEYLLEPGASPADVLAQLVGGRVLLHPLTIVDGWTFAQAYASVRAAPFVRATLRSATPAEVMARLGAPGVAAEGQLYPDTYLVARGTTDLEVLGLAHARLEKELAAAWAQRAPDLPLADPYQALILASIVEKETAVPDERARIAGVFVNRLRLGMRLQTDPTVIYGLGERYDGNIRSRDLQTDTPYNTYTRAGLPPTPIALVGRAALEAAVRPRPSDELYFVATALGDGRHAFSRSYVEHARAVATMLARQRRPRDGAGDEHAGGAAGGARARR